MTDPTATTSPAAPYRLTEEQVLSTATGAVPDADRAHGGDSGGDNGRDNDNAEREVAR